MGVETARRQLRRLTLVGSSLGFYNEKASVAHSCGSVEGGLQWGNIGRTKYIKIAKIKG